MMESVKTETVLGYKVFNDNLEALIPFSKTIINTINQYSYCIAEEDKDFKQALLESSILLPDGIGIVWAAKILKSRTIKKIAGADLHEFLLNKLNETKGSCFYMGSSPTTLDRIKNRIALEYPDVRVGVYSPPYKNEFTIQENQEILKNINSFTPDVLFVGMTAPKQEKWTYQFGPQLCVNGPICSIGAVFDFYAGTVTRPNKLWQKLGLEWFGRLLKEPKRMWRRYIYYGGIFFTHLLSKKIQR